MKQRTRHFRASQGNDGAEISAVDSKVKILVIETFEELMMARQCRDVVEREQGNHLQRQE